MNIHADTEAIGHHHPYLVQTHSGDKCGSCSLLSASSSENTTRSNHTWADATMPGAAGFEAACMQCSDSKPEVGLHRKVPVQ